MIDKIYKWLIYFPGLNGVKLDQINETINGSGMFYRGATVLERSRDLLGNLRCRRRMIFRIRRYETPAQCADFFLQLEAWVERTAPAFGLDQTVCLRDAHCVHDSGGGMALWEADLEITYTEEEV